MRTRALFDLYGNLVCFIDGREVPVDEETKMDVAKVAGQYADKTFERACYDAGIEEPHEITGSPLLSLETARTRGAG